MRFTLSFLYDMQQIGDTILQSPNVRPISDMYLMPSLYDNRQ